MAIATQFTIQLVKIALPCLALINLQMSFSKGYNYRSLPSCVCLSDNIILHEAKLFYLVIS